MLQFKVISTLLFMLISIIIFQEASCNTIMENKMKLRRPYYKRSSNGVDNTPTVVYVVSSAQGAGGGSGLPSLPTLPDTSNLFGPISSVSTLAQQLSNIAGPPPTYYAPPAPAKGGSSSGGSSNENEEDENEDEA